MSISPAKLKPKACPVCGGKLTRKKRWLETVRRGAWLLPPDAVKRVHIPRTTYVCLKCMISVVLHRWTPERYKFKESDLR